MNSFIVFYGLIASITIGWVSSYVYGVLYERYRKRVLDQQVEAGIVPLDYSNAVRELATARNNEVLHQGGLPDSHQERQAVNLDRLRWRVSEIRVQGFDAARVARVKGEMFAQAIAENPYAKGSGEAKQWARGFCQDGGHPPKGWMERA